MLALNLITIKQAPLMEKLEAARQAGFPAVGLWVDEVDQYLTSGGSLVELVRLLRECRLQPAELCAVGGWMAGGRDRQLAAARQVFQFARALGCHCVVARPSLAELEAAEGARDYARLCQLADSFGVRPALEFRSEARSVRSLAAAWQIVQQADHPAGGLMIDSSHFYRAGCREGDLEGIPTERILMVHLNDCPDLPLDELAEADQLLPGMGVAPFDRLLPALREKQYAGHYSLEVRNRAYWAANPRQVARDAFNSMRRLGLE